MKTMLNGYSARTKYRRVKYNQSYEMKYVMCNTHHVIDLVKLTIPSNYLSILK